jgi:glycosyltransferase involved in cell wall biosynthesis
MPERPLKIVYFTAGAAGMFCGSCLHDNTLARALLAQGHDVQLIPLYTPIRTDEEDMSTAPILLGGINMYLQQHSRLFRWLPRWLDRWLDQPWLINWASGRSVKIDPSDVADLTLSILRGSEGNQRKEVLRLVDWLAAEPPPDILIFTNILTAGCIPEIKRRLNVPVVVTLQGDDIFLRALPEPQQSQSLIEIRRLTNHIDAYIAHTNFYADAMSVYLGLDRTKIHVVPLGIDTRDYRGLAKPPQHPPTIGYLARLAPEKGLHILAEAFIAMKKKPGMEAARLRIAGWLGGKDQAYAEQTFAQLRSAGLASDFEYVGEVNRQQKLKFLASLDLLAVPTTYQEPKGLFVLEALAAGVPVLLPDHGAFPELIQDTQGGLLHRPSDAQHLAERMHELLTDPARIKQLGELGRMRVHSIRHAEKMATQTIEVLRGMTRKS